VRWDQPKRFVKKDTQTGSLFLFFSDQNGQNNDILTLTFAGSTGNIDPRSTDPTTAAQNAQKLQIWHQLYALTRQPMYYTLGGTTYQNNFYIIYDTVLIPFPLRFIGFFSKVMDFTEDAEHPFARNYSMQFTVVSTNPSLDNLVMYLTAGQPSASGPQSSTTVTNQPPPGSTITVPL
jgi:hypothetical protein